MTHWPKYEHHLPVDIVIVVNEVEVFVFDVDTDVTNVAVVFFKVGNDVDSRVYMNI